MPVSESERPTVDLSPQGQYVKVDKHWYGFEFDGRLVAAGDVLTEALERLLAVQDRMEMKNSIERAEHELERRERIEAADRAKLLELISLSGSANFHDQPGLGLSGLMEMVLKPTIERLLTRTAPTPFANEAGAPDGVKITLTDEPPQIIGATEESVNFVSPEPPSPQDVAENAALIQLHHFNECRSDEVAKAIAAGIEAYHQAQQEDGGG